MNNLLPTIIATSLISLVALSAVFFFSLKKEILKKVILFLISLSAGVMMADAFFHLLPEAAEAIPSQSLFPLVLISFLFFFLIEKLLHWRHCHKRKVIKTAYKV